MVSDTERSSGQEATRPTEETAVWQRESVGSADEGQRVVAAVLTVMAGLAYAERARERVRQALGEGLASALWCSRGHPARVNYRVDAVCVLEEVEGWGIDPAGPPGPEPAGPP